MTAIYGAFWTNPEHAIDSETVQRMSRHAITTEHEKNHQFSSSAFVGGSLREPIYRNENNSLIVFFDGEIYNADELRTTLTKKGCSLKTETTGELIAQLYTAYGDDFLLQINGPFVLVIGDLQKQTLLLARDPMGERFLYFSTLHDDRCVFASYLKSILEVPDISRRLNNHAIDDYLVWGAIAPSKTIFTDILKLPPGHLAVWKNGELSTRRYWNPDLNDEDRDRTLDDWAEEVRSRLTDAVRLRMQNTHGTVGSFLSGGVDSTILCALAATMSPQKIRSFNIGFLESEYDESAHAKESAKIIGSDHHFRIVTPDLGDLLQKIVSHYEEPYPNPSAFATWVLCAETRRFETMALSGDGGDELFGGYLRYRAVRLGEIANHVPQIIRKLISSPFYYLLPYSKRGSLIRAAKRFMQVLGMNTAERYLNWVSQFPTRAGLFTAEQRAFQRPDSDFVQMLDQAFTQYPNRDIVSQVSFFEILNDLPNSSMTKVVNAARGNGLVCRFPFLDRKLVELAIRIPMRFKMPKTVGKIVLRTAFKDILPKKVSARPKKGFGVPVDHWFRGSLREMLADTLFSKRSKESGIFDPQAVRTLFNEHQSGHFDRSTQLYALLIFELWQEHFMRGSSTP